MATISYRSKGAKPAQPNTVQRQVFVPNTDARLGVITQEITPEVVANALRAAAGGNLGQLQELYIKMTSSDARFRGYVRSFESALLGVPLRLFPSKTGTAEAKLAAMYVQDTLNGMKRSHVIRRFARAYFSGVALIEPIYEPRVASDGQLKLLPTQLNLVAPTLYMMDAERDSPTFGQLKLRTPDEPTGVLVDKMFPPGKLIVVTDGTEAGWYDTAGVCRPCLFWYLVKTKDAEWWAQLNETYGLPHRVAYYEEGTDQKVLDSVRNHLRQLGRAKYALLPSDVELDFMEMNISGAITTFKDIITLANDEMAIAVLGQTQTSDGGKYGSYSKAEIHNSIRFEIVKSVAAMIEESFDQLIRYIVQVNISPDIPDSELPKIRLVVPNPEEREVKGRVFKLAQEIGVNVPKQFAHDELGIPEPDDDDEILEPQWLKMPSVTDGGADQGRDYDAEDERRTTDRHGDE